MFRAKNYKTVSTFVKVMQRKLWLLFSDTAYRKSLYGITTGLIIHGHPQQRSVLSEQFLFFLVTAALHRANYHFKDMLYTTLSQCLTYSQSEVISTLISKSEDTNYMNVHLNCRNNDPHHHISGRHQYICDSYYIGSQSKMKLCTNTPYIATYYTHKLQVYNCQLI